MASVGPTEHRRFCTIDKWEELKGARGKKRDHDYFRKTLANGDVLQTMVSRNKKEYRNPGLWRRIWEVQLGLDSEDQFWEALKTGKPVKRSGDQPAPEKAGIPVWLFQRLLYTAKLSQEEIAKMTPEEAQASWDAFTRREG